ncbi:MAG: DUF4912 domain-containing protein, partial [Candidatus Omnitrophica bacterium]|nr:DUF4912 domain-containing protein [Candidatus Omnitrophota bacterium]
MVLRKLKETLKKAQAKVKKYPRRNTVKTGKKNGFLISKKKVTTSIPKETLGADELIVERSKFSHPEPSRMRKMMPTELSPQYGLDRIILQVRDPRWLHCYWEVCGATWEKLKNEFRDLFFRAKRLLRVYDVSQVIFNGKNAHRYFDIEVADHAMNWYIDTAGPGRSWCIDYGLLLPDGRFVTILRSNTVHTPLEGPSSLTDEEWMIPEEMFARLYGMGFGFGKSSPVGKAWQERVNQSLTSG